MNNREYSILCEHFSGVELESAIQRLDEGEPLAYIIGEWYFWRDTFKLNRACLIPRPDTELLVEKAVPLVGENAYILDICTGSGCIGLSVLRECPTARCMFCDISSEALSCAKENAKLLGVYDRCEFFCFDMLKEIPFKKDTFDIILSNPPYIATDVIKGLDTVQQEPFIALDGGKDGLTFYRALISDYLPCLKAGGHMLLEIGYDQKEAIEKLCQCRVYRDYGGNWRVAQIKKA